MMDLCKDCKHYDINAERVTYGPWCTKKLENPVEGGALYSPQSVHNMRLSGPCGYDGKYWEKKDG